MEISSFPSLAQPGSLHLLVPDGVFVDDEDRLAFAFQLVPTSDDVVTILDRIVIGRRSSGRAATRIERLACVSVSVRAA